MQKVFPFEDEDPVPIASQYIVRYLLAKVEHLQASHWEVLHETPLSDISQIRAEAEAEDEDLEGDFEEGITISEAQEKAEPEQGERAMKRSREMAVNTENEAEVSKVPKKPKLV